MELPSRSQDDLFVAWVVDNGGSEEFVDILKHFGFTSKLSLGNLTLETEDGHELLQNMNYGQRCSLRRLIQLASASVWDKYLSPLFKISNMKEKSSSQNMEPN